MTGLYLPGAAWRPVSYRGQSGLFAPGRPVGYIPHVQVGTGSLWGTFEFAVSPNKRFSNAWIAKDGHSEQYAETNRIPWAQVNGNPDYRAYECEGDPSEPYTAAQINTLATWHNFCGDPDLIADIPGGRGVGTHYMGGAGYGGHTCPDPVPGAGPRSRQRPAIIARAQVLRGFKPVPPGPTPPIPPSGKIVLAVDGVFGPQSRMRLQQWAGVAMDSVLGPISWAAIQRKIGVPADGAPGPITWKALQRLVGAGADGVPGPDTYRHLQQFLNNH